MKNRFVLGLLLVILARPAMAAPGESDNGEKSGLLIMAHGGSEQWNAAVLEAVRPLRSSLPVEVAFGMADPHSLQPAVRRLEEQGVRRIAVVRLFVSAESFREQTEYFLGLRKDPPTHFLLHGGPLPDEEDHYRSGADPFSLVRLVESRVERIPPIETESLIDINRQGLYDSDEIGQILVERVQILSKNPVREAVLVLAHGEGEDELNQQWNERIGVLVKGIEAVGEFREVRAETLREDWLRKREEAMARIRTFFGRHQEAGVAILVVPFRVFGFGPYRAVLEGLDYVADGRGLLPHPAISRWLSRQAEAIFLRNDWSNPFQDKASEGRP